MPEIEKLNELIRFTSPAFKVNEIITFFAISLLNRMNHVMTADLTTS